MPMRSPAALCLAFALVSLAALGTGLAVDREEPNAAVDLTSVRAKVKAKDWQGAIAELKPIVARIDNPDAYNLYAFSLRNIGDHKAAFTYYGKALDFDPNHKSAREYLGELYIITGDMAKAREQETILQKLCPSGCEELDDLRKAIAGANKAK
jgi:Flp pilus assembly protein TadD